MMDQGHTLCTTIGTHIEEGIFLGPLMANGKNNECLLAATKPLAIYMSAEGCLLGAYYWTFPRTE